ncbi:MAG: hypothetical protein JST39_22015 [Bacteroidetes bacterium]|nr:hypothetical protein [Bacteroidota bacterium]
MVTAKKKYRFFFFFLLLVTAIYSPVINKSFSSDDFEIIRRVVFAKHGIFIKGFFRPLSDITLYYLNYCFVGFRPLWYNIYNIISHSCTAWLIMLIAERIPWIPEDRRVFFSRLAALLFITYPFHNEPVVWAVGRASLMAGLFGSLAMLTALSALQNRLKYLLTCAFCFIAMSGYESVLVLPGIILLLIYDPKEKLRSYLPWIGWLGLTLFIHLVVRVLISGVFVGVYGSEMMSRSPTSFIGKWLKVIGRVMLPPMENASLLVSLFGVEMVLLTGAIYLLWKKRGTFPAGYYGLLRFLAMLMLTLIIPLLFGMSTRTYEGDRLFYFPSVVLAFTLSWLITALTGRRTAWFAGGLLVGYQLVLLLITIYNWREASRITKDIINKVQAVRDGTPPSARIFVINVPEEYEGAFVFRHGFYDALWWKGVDTSSIRMVNMIRTEQRRQAGSLGPAPQEDGTIFFPPSVTLSFTRDTSGIRTHNDHYLLSADTARDCILYWDGNSLKQLSLQ